MGWLERVAQRVFAARSGAAAPVGAPEARTGDEARLAVRFIAPVLGIAHHSHRELHLLMVCRRLGNLGECRFYRKMPDGSLVLVKSCNLRDAWDRMLRNARIIEDGIVHFCGVPPDRRFEGCELLGRHFEEMGVFCQGLRPPLYRSIGRLAKSIGRFAGSVL